MKAATQAGRVAGGQRQPCDFGGHALAGLEQGLKGFLLSAANLHPPEILCGRNDWRGGMIQAISLNEIAQKHKRSAAPH